MLQLIIMKKKILLHSCCGPCSTVCIERLVDDYDVTVLYYNPNIYPREEYEKRKENEKIVCSHFNVPFVDGDYNEESWLQYIKGLEGEREGGARCEKCFYYRLEETAKKAKEGGFDIFGTTLTVSPHKSTPIINRVGKELSEKWQVEFLEESFKKKDGYLRSINLSKELSLYRQNYCGCRFSLRKEN